MIVFLVLPLLFAVIFWLQYAASLPGTPRIIERLGTAPGLFLAVLLVVAAIWRVWRYLRPDWRKFARSDPGQDGDSGGKAARGRVTQGRRWRVVLEGIGLLALTVYVIAQQGSGIVADLGLAGAIALVMGAGLVMVGGLFLVAALGLGAMAGLARATLYNLGAGLAVTGVGAGLLTAALTGYLAAWRPGF